MPQTKIRNFLANVGIVLLLASAVIAAVAISNYMLKNEVQSPVSTNSWTDLFVASPDKPLPENELSKETEAAIATAAEVIPAPPTISEQLQKNLPTEAYALYAGIDPIVERLKPQYQEAANAAGIPWQILPALHLREAGRGMSETSSLLNGTKLSADPADPNAVTRLFKQSLVAAATHFKTKAKDIGGIDIKPEGNTLEETKRAFLIYSRGYKAQDPEASPYVMNYLDNLHINMVWPAGDPVAQYFGNNHRDGNPGALATFVHYGGAIAE